MIAHPDHIHPEPGEAREKAIAYLIACGLPPAKAAACVASFNGEIPGSPQAILEAVDRWAQELPSPVPPESSAPDPARSRARMLLAGVPARWPGTRLRGPAPAGLQAALARVDLDPTPDLHQTAMVAQPINLGPLSGVADETWRTFDKWPALRGVAMWTLFLLLLAAVLYTVRF